MEKEEAEKDIFQFLKKFDEKEIFEYNKKYNDKEFFDNFNENGKSIFKAYIEITKKIGSKEFQTSNKDLMIFALFVFLSYVISHLECVKKSLKVFTKESEIDFNENTTLGQLIKKICNKFEYSQKQKNEVFDLFCVDFRNAIAHQHYLMSEEGITVYPHDHERTRTFDIQGLAKMAENVAGLLKGITEYINKKTKELS